LFAAVTRCEGRMIGATDVNAAFLIKLLRVLLMFFYPVLLRLNFFINAYSLKFFIHGGH
jgi:uncharacterized membrane protein YadS